MSLKKNAKLGNQKKKQKFSIDRKKDSGVSGGITHHTLPALARTQGNC